MHMISLSVIKTLLLGVACVQVASESSPGCGKIDSEFLGRDPRIASPWSAVIFYQSNFKCGDFRVSGYGNGVIVGPTTILAGANFLWGNKNSQRSIMLSFKPRNFAVAVGLKSKQPFQTDEYTQFIKISYVRFHPLSFLRYSENDFLLFHLENPIKFSRYVRPVCLENDEEASVPHINVTSGLEGLYISGYNKGRADMEPFGMHNPDKCTKSLQYEFNEMPQSEGLLEAKTPCGYSSKSLDEILDIRDGYGQGVVQERFLLSTPERGGILSDFVAPNLCYQRGSSIVREYNNRWHLVGIVGESLGRSCKIDSNVYFVSFVGLRQNMDWILQNVWYSKDSFVCNNGQITEKSTICNSFHDCDDDSDEDGKYCDAITCTSFSSYCINCEGENDKLKVLRKSYTFSNATNSEEIQCPPLVAPKRITCEYGSDIGTKAVFRCKSNSTENSSYCVITCQENGQWTNELKSFECKYTAEESASEPPKTEDVVFSRNFTSWISKLLLQKWPGDVDEMELESWSPPDIGIGDKTNANSLPGCPGLKEKPGLRIKCRSYNSSDVFSCSKELLPFGTKAEFSCERYYRPIFSVGSVVKTCQANGRWSLENRAFECRLDCGLPKQDLIGHVVNGVVTSGAKWPWHVVIFRKVKTDFVYICGGTLISRKLVVTAAHCVTERNGDPIDADKLKLVLGAISNDLKENSIDSSTQVMNVNNITVNEAFSLASFESDIAILRLEKSVNITHFVRPACFPSTVTLHTELLQLSPGSKGYIIGYGYDESGGPSNKLREAQLPVVSYAKCFDLLKVQVSSTMYCAGYTNGTSACNGDSGGGMFFEDEGYPRRVYLQGIVSHGNRDSSTGLCDKNQYSIFTKVASFKNWISEVAFALDDEF